MSTAFPGPSAWTWQGCSPFCSSHSAGHECNCKPAPRDPPCLSCGRALADHGDEPAPANAAELYDAGNYFAPVPPVSPYPAWGKGARIAWITNHGRWGTA